MNNPSKEAGNMPSHELVRSAEIRSNQIQRMTPPLPRVICGRKTLQKLAMLALSPKATSLPQAEKSSADPFLSDILATL